MGRPGVADIRNKAREHRLRWFGHVMRPVRINCPGLNSSSYPASRTVGLPNRPPSKPVILN